MKPFLILFALAALLCVGKFSVAEDQPKSPAGTGWIVGTVVDEDDKPLGDVVVELKESDQTTGRGVETTTDIRGRFRIEKVIEGKYDLIFYTRDRKLTGTKAASVSAGKEYDAGAVSLHREVK